ncbi:hypothetical protein CNMCM8980_002591 [Aspergillus fumigatiaffinis]|uniref:Calcium channel YVC1-like C-terminal transmembrane domain-containing protein n=1 Tax=Aspergillus fumigatiaffinis TaxID=340414 RepID=A0A8H4HEX7_9EURO|nr:hypothetical protein CNMCM5878_004936 [Aspergillus fumigatiaffinis]KAF4228148.1 hypothetical protein CNMCM6457_007013 [Aspergillus fumigatiaffinis]KAF4244332.1 hypothetical protein CNMCM6805_009334 [Aspergillus fumigatiaffinis]KAF4249885.1 hypothetical protein CNMCM8980_002591 [Aspergillus fumigatiaffinis]
MDAPATPVLPTSDEYPEIPIIDDNESLAEVIRKLGNYLNVAVPDVACTFEQLRSSAYGHKLRLLIGSLAENSHNPWIISALMILKWQLNNEDNDSDWGLNESRGYACEYIAWQFLCHLTRREMIDVLLEELPSPRRDSATISQAEQGASGLGSISHEDEGNETEGERTPLLLSSSSSLYRFFVGKSHRGDSCATDNRGSRGWYYDDPELHSFSPFFGLNALEIAAIAHAKKFLSQKAVQRVIDDIWNGEIVFWDSLSVHSKKKPQFFNKRTADPYSRLRVPMYRKAFEAAFFVSFLFLYYAVLVERKPTGIGIFETLMYVWIAAFAYDELSGMADAGMLLYQMDFWSLWNMGIIAIGLAFVIVRHIRRVRIVLLRATHLPFVALIWAFESSRRYVSQRNNQFPPTQATSTSSIQANFPFSTHHASLHASTVDTSQLGCGKAKGSTNAAQHAEARRVCGLTPNQAGRNDLADMIDELERLRTQVERVAATVAFHQRNRL